MSNLLSPSVPPHHIRLSEQMRRVLGGMQRHVANRAGARWDMAPVLMLLCSYLNRTMNRFDRLLARIGQPRRLPAHPRPGRTRTQPPDNKPRLPGGTLWLIRMVPLVAVFGGQIRYLLNDPDMAALVAAEPGVRRLLNPLLRILAHEMIPPPLRPEPPKATMSPEEPAAQASLASAEAANARPDPTSPTPAATAPISPGFQPRPPDYFKPA